MVLLLYLWENLKKWSSNEEMRVGSGRKYEIENPPPGAVSMNMNMNLNSGMMGGSGLHSMNYEPKPYVGPGGGGGGSGAQDYQQVSPTTPYVLST